MTGKELPLTTHRDGKPTRTVIGRVVVYYFLVAGIAFAISIM